MSFDIRKVSIYDEVAFPSLPFPLSHPDHLATVAPRLVGLQSPPVSRCRVLELGCGAGGNLIPLADTTPGSQFVGVDLSSQQIDAARDVVTHIGLNNIRLETRNLLDFDVEYGRFDYILCHGVYSWTTQDVRDRILTICRDHLSEHGVAYINYNTHPGWHLMGALRDVIQFQTKKHADPEERTKRARMLIDALIAALAGDESPYRLAARQQLQQIQQYSDPFLFHAFLNVVNTPCYFQEFVGHVEAANLQYVGDSDLELMWGRRFLPDAERTFSGLLANATERAQLLDLVYETASRRSLVCHKECELDRTWPPRSWSGLYLSARLRYESSTGVPVGMTFRAPDGRSLTTTDRATGAVLQALADAWPEARAYDELAAEIPSMTGSASGHDDAPTWHDHVVKCFLAGMVQVSLRPASCTRQIQDMPLTTRLARFQATNNELVTNLRHAATRLPALDRRVLGQLDGRHHAGQIVAHIETLFAEDRLQRPADTGREFNTHAAVTQCLARLADNALLLASP